MSLPSLIDRIITLLDAIIQHQADHMTEREFDLANACLYTLACILLPDEWVKIDTDLNSLTEELVDAAIAYQLD